MRVFNKTTSTVIKVSSLLLAMSLSACGGGGGGGGGKVVGTGTGTGTGGGTSDPGTSGEDGLSYEKGVFPNADTLAKRCASPRSGSGDKQGSQFLEKMWLRSWSNNTYLWYKEIEDLDPQGLSVLDYFGKQKTTQTTNSGRAKDRFHFTYNTEQWQQLSGSGIQTGYGLELRGVRSSVRELFILRVEADSPAGNAMLKRGEKIISIDGISVASAEGDDLDALNTALSPSGDDELTHEFVIESPETMLQRTVIMSAENVQIDPVQMVKTFSTDAGKKVGYFYFDAYIATAELGLYDAIKSLSETGIDELVIDARYNGGGILSISAQLAYMIAGKTRTQGRTYETLTFNDKHPSVDPVTKRAIAPLGFVDHGVDLGISSRTSLPSLELPRVIVLTSDRTCSASESLINGLRGIDFDVVLIGDSTCGKPYGFYPTDNCGTTFFTIQFEGQNAKGFGSYGDGFSPANAPSGDGESVKGCYVKDDLSNELGDSAEAMLAAALQYIDDGSCPSVPASDSVRANTFNKTAFDLDDEVQLIDKNPLLNNRWIELR